MVIDLAEKILFSNDLNSSEDSAGTTDPHLINTHSLHIKSYEYQTLRRRRLGWWRKLQQHMALALRYQLTNIEEVITAALYT